MSRLTSQLIVELLDRVTGPAKRVGDALGGISGRVQEAGGATVDFGTRIDAAMARNDRALSAARGQMMDAAAAGYMLYRGLSAPINAAAGFERSMNRVRALSNATDDQFSALSNQARELGRTTMYSASQASDAMGFLAMAGFEVEDILGAMPGTLQLAAAGQVELARAADIASNVLSAYGMEVEELGRVNDVLAATFTRTNTDLNQLAEAMKYAAPVAASAGVQFEEAAAAIGLMGNAGIQGSMAGTSLRGAIARILNPTRSVEDAMAEMGMTTEEVADAMGDFEGASDDISGALEAAGVSFTDAEGKMLPLVDVVRQLEPHADDAGLMMRLFGLRAGPAMAALVSQGADALEELTEGLENSGGTAARIATTQMEGFEGKMMAFRSAVEGVNIAIGNALLPTLTAFAEAITRVLGPVAEFAEAYPQITQALVGATAAVVGFKVASVGLRYIGLLGKGGALSMIAFGYNTIGRAAIGARLAATNMIRLQASLAAMSGQPLGTLGRIGAGMRGIALAIPGVAKAGIAFKLMGGVLAKLAWPITMLVGAGLLIRRYWDRISAVFRGVSGAIGDALRPAFDWLGEKLSFLSPLIEAFGNGWDWVRERMSGISEMISSLFGRETLSDEQIAEIEARARDFVERLMSWIGSLPGRVLDIGGQLLDAGVDLVQSVWDGFEDRWDAFSAWVRGLAPDLYEAVRGWGHQFIDAGRDIIQSLWDGAVAQFQSFLDWVRGIPGRIRSAIGSINLTDVIRWPQPPAWWTRMTGGAEQAPSEPAPVAAPDMSAVNDALATLDRLRSEGPLPTEAYLSGLNSEADDLRDRMAELRREIGRTPSGPGPDQAAGLREAYAGLEAQLGEVEGQIVVATQRADDMHAALKVIGDFEGEPEITLDSIERAIDRARELGRELDHATRTRDVAAPSTGSSGRRQARAKGGPISRGSDYWVGEEGPELITASRSGYVHPTEQSLGESATATRPSEITPRFDVSINIAPTINATEKVDPTQLADTIGKQMRHEVREAFRGVFADTGMRFA